jgi:hypothetical protein
MVEGFPNMMMLMGPHTALGNIPRSIEYNVDWVTGLMRHARDHDLTRVEATEAGVASWTDHVKSLGVGLLSNEVNSWMTGINSNVEGKQTRIIARYSGSAPAYRAKCDAVAASPGREDRSHHAEAALFSTDDAAVAVQLGRRGNAEAYRVLDGPDQGVYRYRPVPPGGARPGPLYPHCSVRQIRVTTGQAERLPGRAEGADRRAAIHSGARTRRHGWMG